MIQYKIIRGYYLTGLGQEELVHHFKVPSSQPEFSTIRVGDIAVTFYQSQEAISYLPALIRVDGIIAAPKAVEEFLHAEQKDGFPMLPILEIYKHFDPLLFKNVMENCQKMHEEISYLAELKRSKGEEQ
ncbi:hypothetical protein RMQ61_11420 [Streptococcus suis]|uniref:hypothetical protein n=1 Tax=Streptococcus suis TaxID=1307 RepID=UPI0028C3A64E|nr:hypothetical protein [Streptococcus suis]WNO82642.1 hypothetical protein RMQ61_11420 [Streptococcus suis]